MGFTVVFALRNVATASTPVTKPATPRTAASHTCAGRSKSSRAVARATSHINAPARTTIAGGGIFDSSDAIRSILCAIDRGCDASPFRHPGREAVAPRKRFFAREGDLQRVTLQRRLLQITFGPSCGAPSHIGGRVTLNVAPPSALFRASSRPLCASTIVRTIVRPIPRPVGFVVTYGSKSRPSSEAGTPGPAS